MSFDGVFTHAIVKELNNHLQSGRLSKIHQPYDNELILVIRSQGKNHKLLLSAHPSYARIQLTDISYSNPSSPTNFCMMLRKFLEGAVLQKIEQIENDRVIHFHFSKRNELGDLESVLLIVELMGRHSTIVLVNKDSKKILDCIKHIGITQNSYRTLLPGAQYIDPPKQLLVNNPFLVSPTQLFDLISTTEELNASFLQQHFQGLGKDTANEIVKRFEQNPNEKMKVWQNFWTEIDSQINPTLHSQGKKEFFTPIPFQTLGSKQVHYPTLSKLLDGFYEGKAEKDRVKQQAGELFKKLENELKKNQLKIKKLEQTLEQSDHAEIYRQKGELLTTFLHLVPKGAQEVTLENYYEENKPIVISLQPALTPAKNAQKYFQRYQKLKNGVGIIKEQLVNATQEVAYLESVLSQLEFIQPKDLDIVREELISQGYIRPKKNHGKVKKTKPSMPDRYLSSDGTTIYVGKNNLQNDKLTLKTAKKTDIWLHAKNIPGSHVIICSDTPTEQTLEEAALLAAYFSKYRLSASVPVDYVRVKHVHKPNGAKPGFVIYENQKTLYVTPQKEIVEQLLV